MSSALLQDKKNFVDLAKSYFYTLLPLLNMPRTALCIQDETGTFIDLSDHDQLLILNLTRGSIFREETVGTSSTSLCLKYGKIVQLPGPLHYCRALEYQLATTTPICDADGNRIGLITIVNHIDEGLRNEETTNRILYWISAFRYVIENQLTLMKRIYAIDGSALIAEKNSELFSKRQLNKSKLQSEKRLTTNDAFSSILGDSPQIQQAIQAAARFAQTDNGILLTGESGTGKEIFAQAIHQASRPDKPFIAINCASIPSNLLASELFGYTGGAFTGADNKGRLGKIELAQDGTLFLDEIGEIPLDIQPIFLRVLEDRKVLPLGSNKEVHVNFRLIAATNRDLYQLVLENKFRADLYYRLEILQVSLPPLRERDKDILLMAEYFLKEACQNMGRSLSLSKEAKTFLLNYDWPGNVRQLKNVILYAANMCQGKVITPQDLPESVYRKPNMSNMSIPMANEKLTAVPLSPLHVVEQEMIKKAMVVTGGNARDAAKILGLSKTSIYRKLKEYNIDIKQP
jgi:transcriptional regulator with PAS, ATPase and Fis domain